MILFFSGTKQQLQLSLLCLLLINLKPLCFCLPLACRFFRSLLSGLDLPLRSYLLWCFVFLHKCKSADLFRLGFVISLHAWGELFSFLWSGKSGVFFFFFFNPYLCLVAEMWRKNEKKIKIMNFRIYISSFEINTIIWINWDACFRFCSLLEKLKQKGEEK